LGGILDERYEVENKQQTVAECPWNIETLRECRLIIGKI